MWIEVKRQGIYDITGIDRPLWHDASVQLYLNNGMEKVLYFRNQEEAEKRFEEIKAKLIKTYPATVEFDNNGLHYKVTGEVLVTEIDDFKPEGSE